MSKRRNRKNRPNLPEEVLARARREAGILDEEETAQGPEEEAVVEPEAPRRQQREELPQMQRRKRRDIDPDELTQDEIYELLANPTRDVAESELNAQYSYVLTDLRSMGALAALLFVIMIVAARFL